MVFQKTGAQRIRRRHNDNLVHRLERRCESQRRSPFYIWPRTYCRMDAYAIFDACRQGDMATLRRLYDADPTVINTTDAKGFTPLILAVYNNQPEAVDFLLLHGADVNAQDAAGNTALMGVAFKGYKEVARKLIDAGADVNLRNANGAPALTFAATFGQLEIAERLLQKGAAIFLPDTRGKTSLDHAVIQENEAMIELLERYVPSNQ